VLRLVPANPDYPTIDIASARDGYIVGTVVEQRRYHQSVKDLYGFDPDERDYEDMKLTEAVKRNFVKHGENDPSIK
jgi:hypothetical protein